MQNIFENFTNKIDPNSRVRHLFEIVRGLMYIIIGGMILTNNNIKVRLGDSLATGLAIIFICYGIYRFWRYYYLTKNKVKY